MGLKEKQEAKEFGDFAEDLAAREYIKQGYTILERKWRLGKTEIDLIARKDDQIVIIEVKARSGKDEDALSAVTTDKRKRMIKAADAYLRQLSGNCEYRFDIVTVTGNIAIHEIEIYPEAFMGAEVF